MAPSIQPDEPSATDGDLDAPADELGDDPAETSTVDWSTLPDAVRVRLAELGADALGDLPRVDVPQSLRPVARFAPAKRARLGGPTIIAALRDSAAYRTAVLQWCKDNRAATLDLSGGDVRRGCRRGRPARRRERAALRRAGQQARGRRRPARRTRRRGVARRAGGGRTGQGARRTRLGAGDRRPRVRAARGGTGQAAQAPARAGCAAARGARRGRRVHLGRRPDQGRGGRRDRRARRAARPGARPGGARAAARRTGPRRTPTSPGSPPARRGRPTRSGSPCWWRRWTAR